MKTHSSRHNAVQHVEADLAKLGVMTNKDIDYVIIAQPGGRYHAMIVCSPDMGAVEWLAFANAIGKQNRHSITRAILPDTVSGKDAK